MNRRIGIELWKEYASQYSPWWEIELTFSMLEETMKTENICYVEDRVYHTAMGLNALVNNPIAISNMKQEKRQG